MARELGVALIITLSEQSGGQAAAMALLLKYRGLGKLRLLGLDV